MITIDTYCTVKAALWDRLYDARKSRARCVELGWLDISAGYYERVCKCKAALKELESMRVKL